MADDTAPGNNSESTEQKRQKRRIRTGSETVRERTEKFQQEQARPVRRSPVSSFFGGFTWPLRALGRQLAKLGRFRVFRILGRILVPRYFRNSWRELRLVTWPDRKTSWKLTYAVIVFSILFGAIVAVVDFGLDKLFKELIIK